MTDQVKEDADYLRNIAVPYGTHVRAELEKIADRIEQNQRRLNWAANELLACDYGDNDQPGEQVGWHVYGWRYRQDRIDRRIYGRSINIAIDAELEKSSRRNSGE